MIASRDLGDGIGHRVDPVSSVWYACGSYHSLPLDHHLRDLIQAKDCPGFRTGRAFVVLGASGGRSGAVHAAHPWYSTAECLRLTRAWKDHEEAEFKEQQEAARRKKERADRLDAAKTDAARIHDLEMEVARMKGDRVEAKPDLVLQRQADGRRAWAERLIREAAEKDREREEWYKRGETATN